VTATGFALGPTESLARRIGGNDCGKCGSAWPIAFSSSLSVARRDEFRRHGGNGRAALAIKRDETQSDRYRAAKCNSINIKRRNPEGDYV